MGAKLNASNIQPVGTWAWEVQPDRVYADAIMSWYFGMEPDEGASGPPIKRFMFAIHEADRPRVELAIGKAVADGRPFAQVYRVKTLIGDIRLIQASGVCFRNERGRPMVYPGHIKDVTAEVNADATLEELRTHLYLAKANACRMRLPMLEFLIDMAALEASGATVDGRRHLN